jgi:hypothetical protein
VSTVWYFAYGSNMQTATFSGRRGIAYRRAVPARLAGWRLVVDKPPLVPIGHAFANIVPDLAGVVVGVLYEITAADMEHVELTEGVRIGNYRRIDVTVAPLAPPPGEVVATTLASDARAPDLFPSDRYMACLVAGAEEHGLPAEWIARLRAIPCTRESADAVRYRPLLDDALRRRE